MCLIMVFHDDVNEKVFSYPNLTIGAKKVLITNKNLLSPNF